VQLGHKYIRQNGHLVSRNQCGYIVPFKANLLWSLNTPEVWYFVCSDHCSDGEVMTDLSDGLYLKKSHTLFRN